MNNEENNNNNTVINQIPTAPVAPIMPTEPASQINTAVQAIPVAQVTPVVQSAPVATVTTATQEDPAVQTPVATGTLPVTPVVSPVAPTIQATPTPVITSVQPSVPLTTSNTATQVTPPVAAPPQVVQPNNTEQVVIPSATNSDQVVIETFKKKGSNAILIVVALLLALAMLFVDEIMQFFEENVISTNPSSVKETDNYNLVDGFILLDDNTSYLKLENIKFYNFNKNSNEMSLSLNYVSDKTYNNVSNLGLYVELYNSNKELLFKEIFNPTESIDKNIVRTYTIKLTSDVTNDSFYALVKTYSKDELTKQSILTCKYELSDETYNLSYKNIYTFTNNLLSGYEVSKEIKVNTSGDLSNKYLNEIKKEYDLINSYKISNTYNENKLNYKIDLNNLPEGFSPLYNNASTPAVIKNKDTLKKWECE